MSLFLAPCLVFFVAKANFYRFLGHDEVVFDYRESKWILKTLNFDFNRRIFALSMVVVIGAVNIRCLLHLRFFNRNLYHSYYEVALSLYNRFKWKLWVGKLDYKLVRLKSFVYSSDSWKGIAAANMVFILILQNVFYEIQLNHTKLIFFQHRENHKRKEVAIVYTGCHVNVLWRETSQSQRLKILWTFFINR